MKNIEPIAPITLSEQVATQIVKMISAGRWKIGDKLPPEPELCEAFNVGRSTLREALKALSFVGAVRMRAGEGTYITGDPTRILNRLLGNGLMSTEHNLRDVIETRLAVEAPLAMLAAARATDEDLRMLGGLWDEMGRSVQRGGEGFLELDIQFHMAIADTSKNTILGNVIRVMREPLLRYVKAMLLPGRIEASHEEHLKILQAIKDHNPANARRAMDAHLRDHRRQAVVLFGISEPGSVTQIDSEGETQGILSARSSE